MHAIILTILGGLGRQLLDKLAFFLAIKALLLVLCITVLPLIIKNLLSWFGDQLQSATNTALSGLSLGPQVVQITGVGAYLGQHLQITTCLTIILSALAFRAVLNFTPFMR